jgi:hypothetical protein
MTDILFMALAEDAVRYVDERYGRAAAWVTAIAMVVLPIALLLVVIWWVAS